MNVRDIPVFYNEIMQFPSHFVGRTKDFQDIDHWVPAPYFRKTFVLSSVKESEIILCGLGFYRLWVNGTEITDGVLTPYISNPDHYLYYDRYDVTAFLKSGKNVIGILLGNGFLNQGTTVWDLNRSPFRDAPKVALGFYQEGKLVFESDSSFLTADSPILWNDYRGGEYYDARKEIPHWNEIDFDDASWDPAIDKNAPHGEATFSKAQKIRFFERKKPVEIRKTKRGYVYVFPENEAGVTELSIQGKRGQTIVLRHGEWMLNDEFDDAFIRFGEQTPDCYSQMDTYVLKGEGKETHIPSFVYHGFQVVLVEGLEDEQATPDLLTYLVMHTDLSEIGSFHSSNHTMNRLTDMADLSYLANFFDFPTDCPHREKNGWTGDAALSLDYFLWTRNAIPSLKEWYRSVLKAMNEKGAIPGIVPTGGWGYDWGSGPGWDRLLFELPYQIYRFSHDQEIIAEAYPYLLRYLAYAETRADPNGLYGYGLGDWCPVGVHNYRYVTETNLLITDTLHVLDMVQKTIRIAKWLNKDTSKLIDKEEKIKADFRKAFIAGGRFLEEKATQTGLAMALERNVFAPEEEPNAISQLLSLIQGKDEGHISIGVFGNQALYRALTEHGQVDLAMKLLLQPSFPSLGYWADVQRFSALPEAFEWDLHYKAIASYEGGKEFPAIRCSHNHHFWGDFVAYFYEDIAGFLLTDDGIIIRPYFPACLSEVSASHCFPEGKVDVSWRKEANHIEVTIRSPEGMKVRFDNTNEDLPVVLHQIVYRDGEITDKMPFHS